MQNGEINLWVPYLFALVYFFVGANNYFDKRKQFMFADVLMNNINFYTAARRNMNMAVFLQCCAEMGTYCHSVECKSVICCLYASILCRDVF